MVGKKPRGVRCRLDEFVTYVMYTLYKYILNDKQTMRRVGLFRKFRAKKRVVESFKKRTPTDGPATIFTR